MLEMHSEWVDPEMVRTLGIARGDVAGHAFVKSKLGEEAEGGGKTLLAVAAFFLWSGELWNRRNLEDIGRCSAHISPRPNN